VGSAYGKDKYKKVPRYELALFNLISERGALYFEQLYIFCPEEMPIMKSSLVFMSLLHLASLITAKPIDVPNHLVERGNTWTFEPRRLTPEFPPSQLHHNKTSMFTNGM